MFAKNFRCKISGPKECGKAFLLKNLAMTSIHFDKLYINGPTGDQYDGTEHGNVDFIKESHLINYQRYKEIHDI